MCSETPEDSSTLLETVKAFHFVHDHYLEDAECFMEADYHTYVLLDSLRWLLSNYDPQELIYFGRIYVVNKEALKRFVTIRFGYWNYNYYFLTEDADYCSSCSLFS